MLADVGTGGGGLVPILAGQTISDASLARGGGYFAGAMSAGYGGAGESETSMATANFSFLFAAPEKQFLVLDESNWAGVGFDEITFEVDVNGVEVAYEQTTNLSDAEAYFTERWLSLGFLDGPQSIDVKYWLTASGPDLAGFGFTYNSAVPEASTWVMTLAGFAALGYAAQRSRARRRLAA